MAPRTNQKTEATLVSSSALELCSGANLFVVPAEGLGHFEVLLERANTIPLDYDLDPVVSVLSRLKTLLPVGNV